MPSSGVYQKGFDRVESKNRETGLGHWEKSWRSET